MAHSYSAILCTIACKESGWPTTLSGSWLPTNRLTHQRGCLQLSNATKACACNGVCFRKVAGCAAKCAAAKCAA
eukprot:3580381-Pleurochrysis_carterae.AAC.3